MYLLPSRCLGALFFSNRSQFIHKTNNQYILFTYKCITHNAPFTIGIPWLLCECVCYNMTQQKDFLGYHYKRSEYPTRILCQKKHTVPVAKWRKELDEDGDFVRLVWVPKLVADPLRRYLKDNRSRRVNYNKQRVLHMF